MGNNVLSLLPKLKEKEIDDRLDKLIADYLEASRKCIFPLQHQALIEDYFDKVKEILGIK